MTAEVKFWATYHRIKIETPKLDGHKPIDVIKATTDFVLSHREWLRSVGAVV